MKKLDAVVRKYGLTHTQTKETDHGYIYEVSSKTGASGWDVFIKKVSRDREATIKGVKIKFHAAELYPSDTAFGVWAWHFMTIEQAEERLSSLSVA